MADQFCYLCGGDGFADLFVICSKCKVVRQHPYCMQSKSHDVPWRCVNCTLNEAKSPDDSGLQTQPKMLRCDKPCKVKFLPTDEVVKLSSGAGNGPSKLNMDFAPQRTFKTRKVIDCSIPRPLFQASKESQERSSVTMPPKVCGVKKQALATPGVKKQALATPGVKKQALATPGVKKQALATPGVKKQALATCLPPIPVGPVQTLKKVKVRDIPACDSSMPRHSLPVTNTGKEVPSPSTKLEDTQKEKKDALMRQEILTYRDCLPSLHASWKGGFKFVDTRMAGEFYDGFLAKPPCVVHGRAYELSRKIPPILQVKLLSRSDIWDDLFHDECPDLADIALYFSPSGNIERSRKNSCLLELMEREDLLIRSLIDGAELVVFTYRLLDLNSQYVINRLNAECLLFGVFRAIKDDRNLGECTAVVPMLEYGSVVSSVESASRVPLLECTPYRHGKHDEGNAVNNEIDTASVSFGKSPTASKDIDSTIQRLRLEFGSQQQRESDVNALTKNVQIKNQEPAPISAIGSHALCLSKVKTEPLQVIKVEGSDDKKRLETEHRSSVSPTFSIDSSQNKTGLLDQDVPKRVADKYLQLFNPGIKKERR